MGLLDLPAPLFAALDRLAAELPPLARLALWAALGGWLSIELYRLLSPQARIAAAADALRAAHRDLDAYDGAFAGARPLMTRLLATAGRRLLLVAPAAIAASLPVLAMIVWLDTAYGRRFPAAGEPVTVRVSPAGYQARWEDEGAAGGAVVVTAAAGREVLQTPVPVPVTVVHKRRWWNLLIGNPAGYLPPDAPVEAIEVDMPSRDVTGTGPSWLRGWEAPFLAVMLVTALLAKTVRRVA